MKKIFKFSLLAFLFLLFISLLAEALLGIVFHYKDKDLEPMAVHDYPYLYYLFDEKDGLNEHGFKTKYPIRKQPGKFRIILTGGSVARGRQPELSIANYLETELITRFNTDRIEVVNAGMSAYVVEQEFLLIQLILQHYEPDMIVSLDGYNDLLTFKLNRQHPTPFELPPHNWQDFRVIADNRGKKIFWTRFPAFFRNISRALNFVQRKNFEKNFDWSSLTDEKLKPVSDAYWQVISDSRDFCKAKYISYYNFLQPLKFYRGVEEPGSEEQEALIRLYSRIENSTREKYYAYSLASLFAENPYVFTDDCHVTSEGNKMIANAIADRITDEVRECIEN